MGKSKNKKESSKTTTSTPKCTCTDLYKCTCGHRPPRPSKGHKWDPEKQMWGGKGHKQKGASGQTASVSQQATTTAIGKTTVQQWQQLPSQLLRTYCQRQKRPQPKFKTFPEKKSSGGEDLCKCRVIVPDPKDSDKDLFFVPAVAVANEEQAKEESALLALLQLTPNLPHEQKLPEPYKSTWLNALEAAKDKKKRSEKKEATSGSNNISKTSKERNSNGSQSSAARASSSLTMSQSYTSQAEKRRQWSEKRKERNARIRRHENIRLANQHHQVFMSKYVRQQIESLLRGEHIDWNEKEEAVEDASSDTQMYVEDRLHREGFTRKQARRAFLECSSVDVDEDEWDTVYEKCLQWLLVNLSEDQLPEGFDPRGRTLDVIAPGGLKSAEGNSTERTNPDAEQLGLSIREINFVSSEMAGKSFENTLWGLLARSAGLAAIQGDVLDRATNDELLTEEIEALEAIFPAELTVDQSSEKQTVLSIQINADFTLEVSVENGVYPSQFPHRVWIKGRWTSTIGSAVHLALLKIMNDELERGEPTLFSLYGHCQSLMETDDYAREALLPDPYRNQPSAVEDNLKKTKSNVKIQQTQNHGEKKPSMPHRVRRPRERKPFWSVPPARTVPANPSPKVSSSIRSIRNSLPAANAKSEFLKQLQKSETTGRVMLVEGDTGCGKTTQIPQEYPKDVKIVVAQPRRLAATGVATRVAEERGESRPGDGTVGYVVRGDSAVSDATRLLFCTTGVLLRQLQSEAALDCVTHIVIDEVHERHLDSDVLMGLLKTCLPVYPSLHVILMSATLDADKFSCYWGGNIPRIHIPGRTFPVTDYTLEDVLLVTGYVPRKKKAGKIKASGEPNGDEHEANGKSDSPVSEDSTIAELIHRMDEADTDYDLLAHLVKYVICERDETNNGSILVFLSGAQEINKAMERIKHHASQLPLNLVPLHGGLQPQMQNLVFRPAVRGQTKVVLATNIAEASVTIPDCVVVIDTAREKQSSYDPANRMPTLVERFASRASLKQRRGRAGRVREGTCYKLISRSTLKKLNEYSDPEIRRCALEQTLLSLLFLGVESGAGSFMNTLLDPPTKESSAAAASSLIQLGAAKATTATGKLQLTSLGVHLAGIPAPPSVGKMLIMGSILGCRDAALAMAAGMSLGRSPFLRFNTFPNDRSRETDSEQQSMEDFKNRQILEERARIADVVGASDHALLAAVYMKWDQTSAGAGERKRACESLGVSFPGMRDMKQLVQQYDASLRQLGFHSSPEANRNSKSWRIIRSCAIAAMAPSQLVKIVRPATKYHETAEGAKEKEGRAQELKFFIRKVDGSTEERVFIHPSSANFSNGSYSCPWLVFHSMVRTSKPFLRDITECNSYPLLLFGGPLEVEASKGLVTIDNWVKLSANARIGALMGGLRDRVDELLSKKVEDPRFQIENSEEMNLVIKLIVTDGLGTA